MSGDASGLRACSVAFLLSQVGGRSAQVFAGLLEPLKLSPADAGVLRMLQRSAGVSQQALAQMQGMHASRLVGVLDALEERGLLVREVHAEDRRLYALRLTDEGQRVLAELGKCARMHEQTMCAGLTPDEVTGLRQVLEKMVAKQGLRGGVHPGYATLRPRGTAKRGARGKPPVT